MVEIKVGDIVRQKGIEGAAMVLSIDDSGEPSAEIRYIKDGDRGPALLSELEVVSSAMQQETPRTNETTTVVLLEIIHDADVEWWQALKIDKDVYYNNVPDATVYLGVEYQQAVSR